MVLFLIFARPVTVQTALPGFWFYPPCLFRSILFLAVNGPRPLPDTGATCFPWRQRISSRPLAEGVAPYPGPLCFSSAKLSLLIFIFIYSIYKLLLIVTKIFNCKVSCAVLASTVQGNFPAGRGILIPDTGRVCKSRPAAAMPGRLAALKSRLTAQPRPTWADMQPGTGCRPTLPPESRPTAKEGVSDISLSDTPSCSTSSRMPDVRPA